MRQALRTVGGFVSVVGACEWQHSPCEGKKRGDAGEKA
jgi:hypothetical protein